MRICKLNILLSCNISGSPPSLFQLLPDRSSQVTQLANIRYSTTSAVVPMAISQENSPTFTGRKGDRRTNPEIQ